MSTQKTQQPQNSTLIVITTTLILCFALLIKIFPTFLVTPKTMNMQALYGTITKILMINFRYYLTFFFGLIFAGYFLDKFNTKYIVSISTLVAALTAFILGIHHTDPLLNKLTLLLGFCNAFILIGVLKIVASQTSQKLFAIFAGIFFTLMLATDFFDNIITNFWQHTGAVSVAFALATIGVLLTLLAFFYLKNINQQGQAVKKFNPADRNTLLTSRNFWLLLSIALIGTTCATTFEAFSNTAFSQIPVLSSTQINNVASWFAIGQIGGPILIALLICWIQQQKYFLTATFAGIIATTLAMMLLSLDYALLYKLVLLLGLFAGGSIILFTFANRHLPASTIALTFSLLILLKLLAGLIFPPLADYLFKMGNNPNHGLIIILITASVSLVLSLFLTHQQHQKKK